MHLSSLIEPETFLKLKEFMVSLVQMRARPPMKSGKIDWQEVAIACRLTTELSSEVKRRAQPDLMRLSDGWLAPARTRIHRLCQ